MNTNCIPYICTSVGFSIYNPMGISGDNSTADDAMIVRYNDMICSLLTITNSSFKNGSRLIQSIKTTTFILLVKATVVRDIIPYLCIIHNCILISI